MGALEALDAALCTGADDIELVDVPSCGRFSQIAIDQVNCSSAINGRIASCWMAKVRQGHED